MPGDFDFLFGSRRVGNRRLVDRGEPGCDEWETFEATSDVVPVFDGLGHIDRFRAPSLGADGFEGLTLRLYEPATGTWRIWWSDNARPGRLDPPMSGRFDGGEGWFADGRARRERRTPVAAWGTTTGAAPTADPSSGGCSARASLPAR